MELLRKEGREHEQQATKDMSQEEIDAVSQGLDKIIENLR